MHTHARPSGRNISPLCRDFVYNRILVIHRRSAFWCFVLCVLCCGSCKVYQLLLFLTFSVLVANLKKLLYTVANPARGLLNREKRTIEEVWQHTSPHPPPPPPTPPTLLVRRKNRKIKITRRIYRRYAGLGQSRVRTRIISSARRLGTRPMGVASQNSTLPSAIASFPVSLLLSSPGDV